MLSDSDTRAIDELKVHLAEWGVMAVRQCATETDPGMVFAWGRFSQACLDAHNLLAEVERLADTYLDDVHAAAAERGQRG